ncbi:hypothetical protein BT63DRAFT_457431 [Microthyrium microscopicum]|uniref:Uncharacterized protein n=1 Tax=Microthyrium microscopicum TaxID=703497 RepID=A0A6A6U3J0_9PEZI|nr:hypothetical protein BT63DRAFT_457431 [Microthyrium microscopicum]
MSGTPLVSLQVQACEAVQTEYGELHVDNNLKKANYFLPVGPGNTDSTKRKARATILEHSQQSRTGMAWKQSYQSLGSNLIKQFFDSSRWDQWKHQLDHADGYDPRTFPGAGMAWKQSYQSLGSSLINQFFDSSRWKHQLDYADGYDPRTFPGVRSWDGLEAVSSQN